MARQRVGWRDVTVRAPDAPFLDWEDVKEITGFAETTIRRMIRDGQFPPQLRGGGWSDMQIAAWMLWRTHGPRPQDEAGEDEAEEPPAGGGTRRRQNPPPPA